MAWTPKAALDTEELPSPIQYVVEIGDKGVAEVEAGLEAYTKLGLNQDSVNPDTFPLPTLEAQLEQACHDIHQGPGFAIIRGLDPNSYTAEENVTIFLAVASHIADMRGVQDKRGNMITHVTDAATWTTPHELRHGIHTTTGLAWHTDMSVNILGLHVRAMAESGGDTFVASASTIFKELESSYPQSLKALQQSDWPIQISGSPPRYILAPLLQVYNGAVVVSVDPGRLGLHPVTAEAGLGSFIPDLTLSQRKALSILSELASKHRLRLDTKPGDMVFINNLGLLHARDAYVDHKTGPRRHLVRLWLCNSKLAWDLPESMRAPWDAAFGDIEFPGDIERKYPAFPARKYKQPRYTAGSAAFIIDDDDDVNSNNT
ncbi:hypothetical protein B0T26DRAFT_639563 [Lasiosphaeria miniovina]|uniref:TauD/TfdA-like domain-containing protein n=1 Tax=Lasiosphaeria miniovina TaxID=1954250 RepID=A0AA40E743_9PEZI|nr:uncharacterized protein B0T26DRAFT_639563 [Lasiosphaeria miniovina]KAK0727492.1 hypothetical protein B0T26DRAFT_639563 [Lasiosphaeria miniovina]